MKLSDLTWISVILAVIIGAGLLEDAEPKFPGLSSKAAQCAAPVRLLQPLAEGFKEVRDEDSIYLSYRVAGETRQVECLFEGMTLLSITPR